MRNISILICLAVLVGCGTFQKNEPGVFQPNPLQKVNTHVSKMVPRAEQVKLSNGIPLPKRDGTVKSTAISPPSDKAAASTNSTMGVTRGLTIIPSTQIPNETQDTPESFVHRLVRYSVIWALTLGFAYATYRGFKKYTMPKDNPFKTKKEKEPPTQLTLKL